MFGCERVSKTNRPKIKNKKKKIDQKEKDSRSFCPKGWKEKVAHMESKQILLNLNGYDQTKKNAFSLYECVREYMTGVFFFKLIEIKNYIAEVLRVEGKNRGAERSTSMKESDVSRQLLEPRP